jgi:hypothetical protein
MGWPSHESPFKVTLKTRRRIRSHCPLASAFDMFIEGKIISMQSTSNKEHGSNTMEGEQIMSVEKAPVENKDPSLRRWRVMEVMLKNGTRSRHVWGHDVTNNAGRASTTINGFDSVTMTVVTHSGRIYKLIGLPGRARKGEYAWQHWCRINGVVSEVDVTDEYFDADKWLDNHHIAELVKGIWLRNT